MALNGPRLNLARTQPSYSLTDDVYVTRDAVEGDCPVVAEIV